MRAGVDACNFTVIVVDTNPPIAGSTSLQTYQNVATSLSMAKVLARDSAPSRGALSISKVISPTPAGATASIGSGAITYSPPANFMGADTLTYLLSDGCGTVPGTIAVTVLATNLPSRNIVSITVSSSGRTIVFNGVPGDKYIVDSSPTVNGPWTALSPTLTAASNGLIQFTDTTMPVPAARFYQIQFVSGP